MLRTWDKLYLISAEEVRDSNEKLDDNGINVPAREGVDKCFDDIVIDTDGTMRAKLRDNPGMTTDDEKATTEEEEDLPGVVRPTKGEGWWGLGPLLSAH